MPVHSHPEPDLGLEFADEDYFFTQHTPHRRVTNYKLIKESKESFEADVTLSPNNTFHVLQSRKVQDDKLIISQSIQTIEGGNLLDFVMRFTFPKETFTTAEINGHKLHHKNQNIYHQHKTTHVTLKGESQSTIELESTSDWHQVMYVRDEPGLWIVHIRLLPPQATYYVVKLNTRWYNKSLPHFLSNLLLFLFPKKLLYRGERTRAWSFMEKLYYWLIPLSAYPIGNLPPQKTLTLRGVITTQKE